MNTQLISLDGTNAPFHAENFALLTLMGCYDDIPFHRVIDGFMIQSGDFENNGTGGNAAKWYGYCNGQTLSAKIMLTMPDISIIPMKQITVFTSHALAMAKTNARKLRWKSILHCSISYRSHLVSIGYLVKLQKNHFVRFYLRIELDKNDRPFHDVIGQNRYCLGHGF